MCYTSGKGAAFIVRALYLLKAQWADDFTRREKAGVPEEVSFATKGETPRWAPDLSVGPRHRSFNIGVQPQQFSSAG